MANRVMPQGDTWPPLRGLAADEDGPIDFAAADTLEVVIKSTTTPVTVITGAAEVIDPPEVDGDETYNWRYVWDPGDTDTPGTYRPQLKVTWAPGQIERFPNATANGDLLIIEESNDG
jgi:hypothetical protein